MTTNNPAPSRRSIKRSPSLEGLAPLGVSACGVALAVLLLLPLFLYAAARSGSEPLTILLLGPMALLMVGLIVLE